MYRKHTGLLFIRKRDHKGYTILHVNTCIQTTFNMTQLNWSVGLRQASIVNHQKDETT